jgi:transposase
VSVTLERFLLGSGEAVVRVPPELMAGARRSSCRRGKSDAIDASAVARAALREPGLPAARLVGAEREIRLLLDHREDLGPELTRIQRRLRWHLHELDPGLELPAGSRDRGCWLDRLGRRLARRARGAQVRICRELVARCRRLTRRERELARGLGRLVVAAASASSELAGCGVLAAEKLIGELAGSERFATDARPAMHAGAAPLRAASGNRRRNRLERSGNPQRNCVRHRIAVTQARLHPPARAYRARKEAEGNGRKEALRCLERHLGRTVDRSLATPVAAPHATPSRPASAPALT